MHYTSDQDFPGTLTDEQPTGPSVDERLAAILSPMVKTVGRDLSPGQKQYQVTGLQTQQHPGRAGGAVERPRLARTPLSNSHNGPLLEYARGGTYAKLRVPGIESPTKPAKRGIVTDFSAKSRMKMLDLMNKIDHNALAVFSHFVTLTYPNLFSKDRKVWRRHFRAFTKRLKRRYNIQSIVWKLEPQERLAPHYHLLVFSHDEIDNAVIAQMWHDVVGTDDQNHLLWHLGELGNGNKPCTSRVNSFDGVKHYVSEYCGKKVDGGSLPVWWHGGRWWGVEGDLPTDMQVVDLSVREAVDLNRIMRKIYTSKVGKKYKQRGMCGAKLYCKTRTIEDALTHVQERERERGETAQPDLVDLHMLAGRGLQQEQRRQHDRRIKDQRERVINAEKYHEERRRRYGMNDRTPEDCRTVLEKFGFVGLQERLEKAGVA